MFGMTKKSNKPNPALEGAKVLGLAVGSVLATRFGREKVLYLSDYLAFWPGEGLLALSTVFAQQAINQDSPESFFLSDSGKRLLWALGATVGSTIQFGEAYSKKRDIQLTWAASQVVHSFVSFPVCIRYAGGTLLPLLWCKQSKSKYLAFACAGAYIVCLVIDITDPPPDYYLSGRQMQRRLIDRR